MVKTSKSPFGYFSDKSVVKHPSANKNSNSLIMFKNYQKILDSINNNFFKNSNLIAKYGIDKAVGKLPIRTNLDQTLEYFHEFCARTELAKNTFIDDFIYMHDLKLIDDLTFINALNPLVPLCSLDSTTGVFTMELNFMPYLKFKSLKDFTKVKNNILYLIMQGISKMKEKPCYGKEPVVISFTMHSKFLIDLDNVEVKYIIDAMRYSHFFEDDSFNYVSILIEGIKTKEAPFITVKVIKKADFKL